MKIPIPTFSRRPKVDEKEHEEFTTENAENAEMKNSGVMSSEL
jgi:hypothetical protein